MYRHQLIDLTHVIQGPLLDTLLEVLSHLRMANLNSSDLAFKSMLDLVYIDVVLILDLFHLHL